MVLKQWDPCVFQKTRYETYLQLLVARLHCPSEDLDLWEEQLGREAGGLQEPKPSLKKSHSSPSLHQDEAPTTAKVKRNISERRTYRKIIPNGIAINCEAGATSPTTPRNLGLRWIWDETLGRALCQWVRAEDGALPLPCGRIP